MIACASPAAVLFDLDGTLLDTAPDLAYALNRVRGDHRLAPLPLSAIRPHVSNGSCALTRVGFDLHEDSRAFEQCRQQLLTYYQENLALHTRLFDGMEQVLAAIAARGQSWGIVTNKPAWLTDPLLDKIAFVHEPACVVSGDSTARAKPHPEPLLSAAEQVGVAPQSCLYIGDAVRDVEAARSAQMPVIVARYGYIGVDEDPATWDSDGVVDSPLDILAWL